MKSDFITAINQLSSEKGVSKNVVLQAVEAALVSAYRRNFNIPAAQKVVVHVAPQTGQAHVFVEKQVVEAVKDPRTEITLAEARAQQTKAQVGNVLEVETTPSNFGRIAAQTAKQVVLQRLREAERDMVFDEYAEREGDIITGIVHRIEPKAVILDLGKAEATLPASEQVISEHYHLNQRLKVYVVEVERGHRGPQITVSRTHRSLIKRLFELEVPEIYNGVVEIKSIAREPGARSKVAVYARQEGVDPVGACVGMRGVRIQNIVNELGGEKIDVVQWHPEAANYIANALSPAQVVGVQTSEADKTATVMVPERQLSLAIGKEGQNARLAAKLTGWRIDIKPSPGLATAKVADKPAAPRVESEPASEVASDERGEEL
ncbi:MAG: transcription termination factor NusA [Chloroflexi bacterium]|nr:transcription termination factor NusA [Chloroflexota bacterium]MCL5109316.1 transcription termination factor NusA [Chloroflexota bacterium]